MALWGGRFSADTDNVVTRLSESVSFDWRLYAHDIRGSIAHVNMLGRTGIITDHDARAIVDELTRIRDEIDNDAFSFSAELEDIHMNIENRLIERLGDTGARVHTARSRNDQVATDIRLYLRDEIDHLDELVTAVQCSLVQTAEKNSSAILPGLTHLQHGQPVLFAHHLLAYVEMLARDRERLSDTRRRLNQLPLGAGALAGTTLPIDRASVANELGFDGVMRNSMDAVSDRDFALELAADLAILMMHLSRLSEDIIFWVSQACSYVELGDAFCTGSSLMPQKKNPDIAELTRGKTGRVYGNLNTLLTIMKGLPLCYNRDLQEDKEPLFDTIDTVKLVLAAYGPMISSMIVDHARMLTAASDPALMATDLAEWLVRRGLPFRTAHHRVGKLVGYCHENNKALNELTLTEMQHVIPEANDECLTVFAPERSVAARNIVGGTAPQQVMGQLDYWRGQLNITRSTPESA